MARKKTIHFLTCTIMALHKFLPLTALTNILSFTIPFCPYSAIYSLYLCVGPLYIPDIVDHGSPLLPILWGQLLIHYHTLFPYPSIHSISLNILPTVALVLNMSLERQFLRALFPHCVPDLIEIALNMFIPILS